MNEVLVVRILKEQNKKDINRRGMTNGDSKRN